MEKKENFFTHKFLPILSLFILTICLFFVGSVQAVEYTSETGVSCSYPDEILSYMEQNYSTAWNDTNISWLCWKWGNTYYLHGLVLNTDSIVCYNHDSGVIGVSKKGRYY